MPHIPFVHSILERGRKFIFFEQVYDSETSRCTLRWPLRYAVLPDNYRLYSHKSTSIAASIVYSKLYYCNSLSYNLPESQINRLQQIQNCLARTVVKAHKSSHITPILRSLHWLKINEHIEFVSLTHKVPTTDNLTTYTI